MELPIYLALRACTGDGGYAEAGCALAKISLFF